MSRIAALRPTWSSTRNILLPAVFFLALSVALYGNTLRGSFVYDDVLILIDGDLREPSYLTSTWLQPSINTHTRFPHYRPLTFFTFALNFLFTGESPVGFHVVSILLNGLAAWLLFLLTRRLFGNVALAACIAMLFAVFPIHAESVAYIKARDELLVACFGLAAWLAFLRSTEPGERRSLWAVGAAIFSLFAFFSKESALVLPGVLAGAHLMMRGWRDTARQWMPLLLQCAVIVVYFVLHAIATGAPPLPAEETLYFGQNPLGYMDSSFIPWTALSLLFIAVAKTFVPWNLTATYGFAHIEPVNSLFGNTLALPGLVALSAIVALIMFKKTRTTPAGIGAMTFAILYFPFSKIPFIHGIDFFAERWLYAPSIGLSFIGGYTAWAVWNRWRKVATPVLVVVLSCYALVLMQRNLAWRDNTTLGESMVRDAPHSVLSYEFLARDRFQQGHVEEAAALTGKGLDITRRHIPLHYLAAEIALDMELPATALQALDAVTALGEREYYGTLLRSTILAKQGQYLESLEQLEQDPSFDPFEYRTRFLLALNLWWLGKTQEAELYFDWDAHQQNNRLSHDQKIWIIENF